LCPVLAQRLHENGEHQYLVQLGDAVYPAWYFADGLSAELKSKRAEFDAWCDAELAAGRKLPRPSKTPVPSFAWEKPCLEQVPDSESEDDKDDGDSLDSDDSEFEPPDDERGTPVAVSSSQRSIKRTNRNTNSSNNGSSGSGSDKRGSSNQASKTAAKSGTMKQQQSKSGAAGGSSNNASKARFNRK